MRLCVFSIICSAFLFSGCVPQKIPANQMGQNAHQISSPPATDDMFQGTWECYPTSKLEFVAKIIFLPDHRCRIMEAQKGKLLYDNYNCTYKLTYTSAIVTVIDFPNTKHSSISTNQITPIDNGKLLDLRLLRVIQRDKTGKQTIIKCWNPYGTPTNLNKVPDYGRYTLHRVTSLKDIFGKL